MTGETVWYRGGRIFTASDEPWAEDLVARDGLILFVGSRRDADAEAEADRVVELAGALVIPGIVDAHTHLVNFGRSLQQLDLFDAADLGEIQERLRATADRDPESPRIIGRSWLVGQLGGRSPHRAMLDAAVSDRAVYLVSNDLHSAWVNSAALAELGIDAATPDPLGGQIIRDAQGQATGLLLENAALGTMRDYLESVESDEARDLALDEAVRCYLEAGVTSVVDMGTGEEEIAALRRAKSRGSLRMSVACHWVIDRTGRTETDLEQVRRAIELRDEIAAEDDPNLRIEGIKLFVDGVIDSRTAAMNAPFDDGSQPEPMWDIEALAPVVIAADAAGLTVAMHAIGDRATTVALDAIELAIAANGPGERRHRIEHLETVTSENVHRIARLGVTASVQPVHADPAIQQTWREALADERVERGFPWSELDAAGARIVLGTDAPTAPYAPLPNLYIATTRQSASDPDLAANGPGNAMPLERALLRATAAAAAASGWDRRGVLAPGFAADFAVLDRDPFVEGVAVLNGASVSFTVVGGVEVRPTATG